MSDLLKPLMRADAEVSTCFACDKSDFTWDCGSNAPELRACEACLKRYGYRKLSKAADEILAAAIRDTPRQPIRCGHCETMIEPDSEGRYPSLMCGRCNAELKAKFRGVRASR